MLRPGLHAIVNEKEEFFDDLEDGCGCVEFWEHASERRAGGDD